MSNFLYRKKNRVRMTPPNLFSLFSVRLVLTIDQENTGVIRLFVRSGLIQVQFIRSNKIMWHKKNIQCILNRIHRITNRQRYTYMCNFIQEKIRVKKGTCNRINT